MWEKFLEWWRRPQVEEENRHQRFFDAIHEIKIREETWVERRDHHVALAQTSEKFLEYGRAASHWAAAAYYQARLK